MIKLLKFIGFLIWVGVLIVLFEMFGWGGVIVGVVVSGGAVAIFSDN